MRVSFPILTLLQVKRAHERMSWTSPPLEDEVEHKIILHYNIPPSQFIPLQFRVKTKINHCYRGLGNAPSNVTLLEGVSTHAGKSFHSLSLSDFRVPVPSLSNQQNYKSLFWICPPEAYYGLVLGLRFYFIVFVNLQMVMCFDVKKVFFIRKQELRVHYKRVGSYIKLSKAQISRQEAS